ncbi:phosphate acyltransferase [Mycoplasma sp. 1018B]|uniref:phosphate acyltransferase n=1 Tax=Mycoplasma sp. 1018B TaxID=2967302 RepID=UPI00211C5EBD|nr:phosphate acyltransferase [Mycoplasma sp. 1018B]UUM19215.1 phosphate acyltransferase [Mycoplasma sp. 1018B]
MNSILKTIKLQTKNNFSKILFIEGENPLFIKAAKKIYKKTNLKLFFLKKNNNIYDINNNLIWEANSNNIKELINYYVQIKKTKTLHKNQFFDLDHQNILKLVLTYSIQALLLLKNNFFDAVIGGIDTPTNIILKACLDVLDLTEEKTLTSAMLLHKKNKLFNFTDVAVIPEPSEEQIINIAKLSTKFLQNLNIKTKTAFLSFSTLNSAQTKNNLKIFNAAQAFEKQSNSFSIGEIQFDAAINKIIWEKKIKNISFQKINNFIFPNLAAANICYKSLTQLAKFNAYGPFILGTNKVITDISRGANLKDIINTILITSYQLRSENE